MTRNSKIVIGVATAVAAGTAIGMLFGTNKGSAVRDKVREAANNFANDLLATIKQGRNQYANSVNDVEDSAKRLKSRAIGKVAELKDRMKDTIEDTADTVLS